VLDYHVHTNFSSDAKMSMKEACQAGLNKGVTEIAFTEHLDVIYPDSNLDWDFDIQKYSQTIQHMSQAYPALKIVKGVEVGLHPSGLEKSKDFTDRGEFDFIIGSIHVVGDKDMHEGEFFRNKSVNEALEEYFLTVNSLVKAYPYFNVLGHLDLVKRYLKFLDCKCGDINWHNYYDIVEDTLKELIYSGRGIELNMSGYRYGINTSHPDFNTLKLYRELGGEIITIGSDAHKPMDIGYKNIQAVELLQGAKFKYLAGFSKQIPQFYKIGS